MMHVERIIPIVKLNLRLQCWSQVYVIIDGDAYIHVSGTITIDGKREYDYGKNDQMKEIKEQLMMIPQCLLF